MEGIRKFIRFIDVVCMIVTVFYGLLSLFYGVGAGLCFFSNNSNGTPTNDTLSLVLPLYYEQNPLSSGGYYLCDFIFALTDFVAFFLMHECLHKLEKEGSPFTERSVKSLKILGIKTLVLPFIAETLTAVVVAVFSVEDRKLYEGNLEIFYGLFLLLLAVVCDYARREIEKKKEEPADPALSEKDG
ncbi:MAG: hypothetical protein MJ072_00615 [Clostridia bacterium]|nr:hypothetical protein [Clostridia bacterium]